MTHPYQHIFFDLDHTLWDFKGNSRKTLEALFTEFGLRKLGVPDFPTFMSTYEKINELFWVRYRAQEIDKQTLRNRRFPSVLATWDIVNDDLSRTINERYLQDGPKQPGLMPNALETLDYLQSKYEIHLITNGFKEVQATKLASSGLEGYFRTITTSEEIGVLKPHPKVFHHALGLASARAEHSIYVGDHFDTDVIGSKNAGIDQVFFNPENQTHPETATFEIRDLGELKTLF